MSERFCETYDPMRPDSLAVGAGSLPAESKRRVKDILIRSAATFGGLTGNRRITRKERPIGWLISCAYGRYEFGETSEQSGYVWICELASTLALGKSPTFILFRTARPILETFRFLSVLGHLRLFLTVFMRGVHPVVLRMRSS